MHGPDLRRHKHAASRKGVAVAPLPQPFTRLASLITQARLRFCGVCKSDVAHVFRLADLPQLLESDQVLECFRQYAFGLCGEQDDGRDIALVFGQRQTSSAVSSF